MRNAVLLARNHGQTAFDLLAGPETPYLAQNEAFREFIAQAAKGPHPELAEVQFWSSDQGLLRTVRFSKPATSTPQQPAQPADESAEFAVKQ